jgi:hypothetical protein
MRLDGLADRLAGRVTRGRAAAEALFGCTFDVFAPAGFDKVGGLEVQKYDPKTATPGKIQGSIAKDGVTRSVTVGGVSRPLLEEGLHIPISAQVPVGGDRGIGWEYQCTAVSGSADPALVGRRYLVVNVPAKTYATARRLDVVEVEVPA